MKYVHWLTLNQAQIRDGVFGQALLDTIKSNVFEYAPTEDALKTDFGNEAVPVSSPIYIEAAPPTPTRPR